MRTCVRTINTFNYVDVTPNNLEEVIAFLGTDFVAITGGQAIQYRGMTIRYNNDEQFTPEPNLATGLIVFNVNDTVKVAAFGSVIIKDPMLGYIIASRETFDVYYGIDKADESTEEATAGEPETVEDHPRED